MGVPIRPEPRIIMPICHLYTNRKDSELKDGIELRIANVVAEVLGKPIERVTVVVVPGVRICRQETSEPACNFTIGSIAVFDSERNSVCLKKDVWSPITTWRNTW